MIILVDTNVLTRIAQPGHPLHQIALDALDSLTHTETDQRGFSHKYGTTD